MYLLQNDYHIKVNQHIYNLTYLQFSYFGEDFFFPFFAAAMAGGSSGAGTKPVPQQQSMPLQ